MEQFRHLLDLEEGRNVLMRRLQQGFSLIELMIGLAIVALVLMVALPSFTIFLQNAQIRNGAESVLDGLNLARTEAVRRNAIVRFQFVSDLTAACALSTTSLAWVVSQADPTGACNAAPSDTAAPQLIQARSATEVQKDIKAGRYPGMKKAPEKSQAIIEGLGNCYYPMIDSLDAPPASGHCARWVEGTNIAFGFVESPPGHAEEEKRAAHEMFVYVPGETGRHFVARSLSTNPYPAYSPTGHILYVDAFGDSMAIFALPFSVLAFCRRIAVSRPPCSARSETEFVLSNWLYPTAGEIARAPGTPRFAR